MGGPFSIYIWISVFLVILPDVTMDRSWADLNEVFSWFDALRNLPEFQRLVSNDQIQADGEAPVHFSQFDRK
jgi:hypothetical protein